MSKYCFCSACFQSSNLQLTDEQKQHFICVAYRSAFSTNWARQLQHMKLWHSVQASISESGYRLTAEVQKAYRAAEAFGCSCPAHFVCHHYHLLLRKGGGHTPTVAIDRRDHVFGLAAAEKFSDAVPHYLLYGFRKFSSRELKHITALTDIECEPVCGATDSPRVRHHQVPEGVPDGLRLQVHISG